MNTIAWIINSQRGLHGADSFSMEFLTPKATEGAGLFHRSFPEYSETPLRSLKNLANALGVGGIFVKDESLRFGLNSFKVLGASYAMGKYIAATYLETDMDRITHAALMSSDGRSRLGQVTFTTATDGNHGRGVAWTARRLGQKAKIFMPAGASPARVNSIRKEGADVILLGSNYDDAVRQAAENARNSGWILVQDTVLDGYEEIPTWIMQGYTTIIVEALDQIKRYDIAKPTHIFLQAGVGSFAGSIIGYCNSVFQEDWPKMIVVEPICADCLYRSALAGDGQPRTVQGELNTIMAGLACGKPNRIAWEIVRDSCEYFFHCPDWVTARGMRILGNPLELDIPIISGESGAVTTGLLSVLMQFNDLRNIREQLGLNKDSLILLISTEGDTDPENYRRIVWDGILSTPPNH